MALITAAAHKIGKKGFCKKHRAHLSDRDLLGPGAGK
jgi:hypothetical protein